MDQGQATLRDVYELQERTYRIQEDMRREILAALETFKTSQSMQWETHRATHTSDQQRLVQEYVYPLREWNKEHTDLHSAMVNRSIGAGRWWFTTIVALMGLASSVAMVVVMVVK